MLTVKLTMGFMNYKDMITFKAKIKDKEEWAEGKGLVFDDAMNQYVILESAYWVDSWEWSVPNFWIIDIETLIINNI